MWLAAERRRLPTLPYLPYRSLTFQLRDLTIETWKDGNIGQGKCISKYSDMIYVPIIF